jgi:predicted enzyme related to lactoylglutathione lyase
MTIPRPSDFRLANLMPGRPGLSLAATVFLAVAPSGFAANPAPPLPPLSSVSGSSRLPGKFVWADLVTDDVAAARNFYGRLFGWTFRDAGGYLIAANEERPLCGMFKRARPTDRPEAKPRWFGYISVKDVEKARHSVTNAGGRVVAPPQKLPKRGEQAIFADPEGALFGVVRSSSGDPPDFMADPGDWIWVQLLSRDASKAAAFYRAVAGYEVRENSTGPGAGDYVLTSEGYARATVRTIPRGHEKVQPNWLPFVRVKNLGESLVLAKQLGGDVRLAPKPELFNGQVAVIADPTGAVIGLMEWSDALMKGGR